MDNLDKIKERIAKLLAMAKDTSSPEEAAIAAARARNLMDKHQLDEFDVSESIQDEFVQEDLPMARKAYASMPLHLDFLAVRVAQYNDCQAVSRAEFTDPKRAPKVGIGKRIVFRGYKTDVELAKQMFAYLISQMNAQCKAYLAPMGYTKYPVGIGSKYKDGWVSVVNQRLVAMTQERRQLEGSNVACSGSNALVIVKEQNVNAHFGSVEYKEKSYSPVKDDDHASAAAKLQGMRDGQRVEIVKSVEE